MKKTVWIARTAVCLALLIAIQFLTKSLGQLVTGSCVNLVLAIAALIGGVWSGVTVAGIRRKSMRRLSNTCISTSRLKKY